MILDFPNSPPPTSGDTYTAPNGQLYVFDGQKWIGSGTDQPDQSDWAETSNLSLAYIRNKPTAVSQFTNDAGYITTAGATGSLSVVTNSPGTNALSYSSGVFTFTPARDFQFSVAADDSTQRLVSADEVIKFSGSGIVTTSSDAEGNITIAGSITSSTVTTALGFTPYNATNPAGYTTNVGTVTSVGGTGTVSGLTLTGTVTTSGSLTLGGTLSLTSGQITTGLGFTPYNATNPSGYISTSGLSVTTNAAGTNALSYSNGVFTFTPTDLSSYATTSYVGTQISNLIDSAPTLLNTLNELAAALGDDPNFATTITTALSNKYDASNPAGYTTNTGTVTSIATSGTVSGLTLTGGTITTSGTITLGGTLSLTSGQITTGLGFTPYNATNPSGYISSYTETDTLNSVTGRGNTTTNDITVGNLYPSGTSNTKDLGSTSKRWHTLYVGPGSIDINGATITESSGTLSLNAITGGTTKTISLATDGIVTLPNNSQLRPNGAGIDLRAASTGYAQIQNATADQLVGVNDTSAYITTNLTTNWTFDKTGGLTFPDTTRQTTAFPSYLLNTDEHVLYVSEIGNDNFDGLRPTSAFASVKKALQTAQANNNGKTVVFVQAGLYSEIFPLYVPPGTTVKGAGLKAVTIQPTSGTRDQDAFHLDDNTSVSDLTIRGQLYNAGSNTGYAFTFNPAGITITERSPYIERVTVLQKGSVTSSSDPYGFAQGDAGRGVFLDGSKVNHNSIEPAMLFNECTFFTPNSRTLIMTNGARSEWLNCFSYFADQHIEAYFGSTGYGGAGKTYVTLVGKTGTWSVGNTLRLYANDHTTILGSGVIEAVNGSYLTLTGNVTGLITNSARVATTIIVTGSAQLSTAQFKFTPSSLILNGTTDYISVASTPNYAYANSDFTIETWIYATAIGGGTKTIVDQRTAATDVAVSLEMNNGGNIRVYINGAARITSASPIVANTWTHIAYSRTSGVGRLFMNGVVQATTYTDGNNYGSKPLVIGAAYNALQYFTGYIDEFRISTGISRYTTTFTPATQPFSGDSNTATLLHFTGANASTSIVDDGVVVQDVRSSGGGTATGISRYDRAEFGALLRANGGAMVYGNAGAKATGAVSTSREDVVLQLMSYNIAYIGTGADLTNNKSTVVAASECVELTGGRIIYVSVDQSGKFKVGNLFQVDFDTGAVTFSGPTYNVTSLSGITFTSGSNTSYIDGNGINTGNLILAGNTISTSTGNIILDPAGNGTLALNGDTTVTGALTVTNGVTFGANGTQTQAVNYLNDLLDVTIAGTPTNGYVLKYNSTTGQWGPAPDLSGGGGGGGADLSAIYVTTSAASGGGALSYDGAGQFFFAPADLSSYATTASLSSYATQTWVTSQGYLTGITSGQVTGALGYTPIQYTSLSVSTNTASGSGSLSYNNTNGVFTFTPPSLSSYLTASSLSVTTTTASGGGSLSYTGGVFTFAPTAATTINGTAVSPGGSISVGTVTSIATAGTVNGITLTGGTITSSGTITLGGTLSGIGNSQLTNSTISGVSLGSNLNALTISSPLSGTSYNGSSAVTIALSTGYGDTQNPYASKTANYVLAAPNGTAGVPTFRALVAADIPALSYVTSVSGTGTVNGITLTGTVTSSGSLTLGGTLSGIGNSQLTNSTISGVSLGSNLFALTAGTGISYSTGTTYNGSAAITINNSDTGSAQNIFKTVAVSGQTSVTAASNTATLTLVAGTNVSITTDNTAKSVTINATSTPTFTSITTSDITITGQIIESVNTYTSNIGAGATVTLDCTTGNLWRVFTGTVSGNWTAALTNVTIANNQATNVTIVITQGATAWIPNAISVNGTASTISWQGGVIPTGNANKTDAVAFSIMQTAATPTFMVLGQLVSFG